MKERDRLRAEIKIELLRRTSDLFARNRYSYSSSLYNSYNIIGDTYRVEIISF